MDREVVPSTGYRISEGEPTRYSLLGTRRWTSLLEGARSGVENMAIDQTLLDRAETEAVGFVRVYRWFPHCLSFGRNEPALRRYNRAEIERRGIDAVRRPTGGRAVWHAREVTYAVAAPIEWFGSLAQSYHTIHQILATALQSLGIETSLAPSQPAARLTAGACFASPAGGEVLVNGRKLIGSAQLRQGSAFLQHGSILLEDDQRLVAELTNGTAAESDEITLREAAGRAIRFDQVAEAILSRFEGAGIPRCARDDIRPSTAALRHFGDPAWTWRR